MSAFNEVRPFDGMWAPLQARLELRKMFERWLPARYLHQNLVPDEAVDELAILELSQHYRLEYPGGEAHIGKSWDESEQRLADGGPTFADLVHLGWVHFDGGRWLMERSPMGTSSHITYPSPATKIFLKRLGTLQLVAKADNPSLGAKALSALISEHWLDRHIPTKHPKWLAGRLWERLCPKPQTSAAEKSGVMRLVAPLVNELSDSLEVLEAESSAVDNAFLEWSAWCSALGIAASWDTSWGPTEMRYCREAACRALDRQTVWGTWANDITRYAELLESTFAISRDQLRYGNGPRLMPPGTLVFRADWLGWPEVEHLMMERLRFSTVSCAFGLLCSELENTEIGPSIPGLAARVFLFAAERPMALQQLLLRVDAVPALLVDMLMHERAAPLGTKLIIEWRSEHGRQSDSNLVRDAQTKGFAVQDGLSLMAYLLDKDTLDLKECASLISWCYSSGAYGNKAVADSRRPIGRQLLGIVAKEAAEIQTSVLRYLVDQADYENNVPRARFAGVLEALNILPNIPIADALPIVGLYANFACDMHLEWTDASSLPPELAARLVQTAFAQGAAERDALLVPFDSVKLLRDTPDDEKASLRSTLARTLRAHVRLLARAVAGWPDSAVPTELCDALQVLVSRSVVEHAEKGRVGALTDRYSQAGFVAREDGSPAFDLTAAWRRLGESHQEAMLQTLALSDDPVLLAQICQNLPAAAKVGIQARLRQLTPGEASTVWTWPELQQRVSALLMAGEYGLAREHLEAARQDLGSAPREFRLGFFGLELQLLLKERNWTALDSAAIPPGLDEATKRQAKEKLDFYLATSQLLRPDGKLEWAGAMLKRLAAQPGASSAYRENAFAVSIQQLLGPSLHPLTGENLVIGERLLGEITGAVGFDESLANSNMLANRALLLLALQRPKIALDSVAASRQHVRSPDLEFIAVLAKSALGMLDEATAILDQAIAEFGLDDRFSALKNDLQAGVASSSVAVASVAVDPISSIRAALQQLIELPPSQIGDVLGPPGRGVRGYLVRQVSRAVAALQHMSAMLRDRKNVKDEAKYENDLNTAVREILGASLSVVKWDVGDQSLGGTTSSGNPGERDAVIRVSGQEISIYEALVCSGLNRSYTKQHFDKLVSYGVCDTYFHVTYSYAEKLKPLLDYVREMLEHEAPAGLTYLRCEILEPPDYEVCGYLATYRTGHREVAVVFLVADLRV